MHSNTAHDVASDRVDSTAARRALLDRSRLAVAGALAVSARSVDELIALTEMPRRSVVEALGELRAAGLADHEGDHYWLDADALRQIAADTAVMPAPADPSIVDSASGDERAVLWRWFSGRSLTEIPTASATRHIVLERIAQEFEVGKHFSEATVNERLGEFHADVAALRRYLVDADLLDRADGVYWRSGGRVDV
ncbi:MAG: DUF2087 domain-containing protein [Actinomycetota bacterium]